MTNKIPKPKKRRGKKKLPAHWDDLITWEFRRIIYIIETIIKSINVKRILRNPHDKRQTLYGLLSGNNEIWISIGKQYRMENGKRRHKRYPLGRIIMHEALHVLYPKWVREANIFAKENMLWERFTDEQRRYLRKYIPEHISRKEPTGYLNESQ